MLWFQSTLYKKQPQFVLHNVLQHTHQKGKYSVIFSLRSTIRLPKKLVQQEKGHRTNYSDDGNWHILNLWPTRGQMWRWHHKVVNIPIFDWVSCEPGKSTCCASVRCAVNRAKRSFSCKKNDKNKPPGPNKLGPLWIPRAVSALCITQQKLKIRIVLGACKTQPTRSR